MPYFMIVLTVACLGLATALGAMLDVRRAWLLAVIDFMLTFAIVFGVASLVADTPTGEAAALAGVMSIAGTIVLLVVRVIDQRATLRQGHPMR